MSQDDNNNFSKEVKHRLIDLGLSVSGLARLIRRPRSTVSRAINAENKFPKVRKMISRRLSIALPQTPNTRP